MKRDELRKLIKGPILTVPTAFDGSLEVDHGRMTELTEWWVESGLVTGKAVIKVGAVGGEGDKLRDSEWPGLLETVVRAARGRATIMGAIHHKDTLRAVEDAKKAQDIGVVGLQVSPPIFNSPDQDDMVSHYEGLSDAVDIGILIYNTPWWRYGAIYPETFRRMVDFEQIVCIKWSPPEGVAFEDIFDLKDTFNIIDNTVQPVPNHKLGGHGWIQTISHADPPHDLRIWELMEKRRYDEAQALFDSVIPKLRAFGADHKEIMALLGQPCGPSRPPAKTTSDEKRAALADLLTSFGWPVVSASRAAA